MVLFWVFVFLVALWLIVRFWLNIPRRPKDQWLPPMYTRGHDDVAERPFDVPKAKRAPRKQRYLVEFGYVNAQGGETQRTVTLEKIQISDDREYYLNGYDRLSKERRTFKFDRMRNIRVDGRRVSHEEFAELALSAVPSVEAKHW